MQKLNVSQICKINAVVKEKCDWIIYSEKQKLLFFTIQKEGFYDYSGLSFSGIQTCEALILKEGNKFIENKEVFFYPHLELYMSNQAKYYKWFKTKEELENYIESEELKVNKWLCL